LLLSKLDLSVLDLSVLDLSVLDPSDRERPGHHRPRPRVLGVKWASGRAGGRVLLDRH
jgi:hypothetical protein